MINDYKGGINSRLNRLKVSLIINRFLSDK